MKNRILKRFVLVSVLALVANTASAGPLDDIRAAIQSTQSSGKMISIWNNFAGITFADGSSNHYCPGNCDSVYVANNICDLIKKPWHVDKGVIYCIAK